MSQGELLEMVLKSNCKHYASLMFNLYESEKYVTFEAVFDDDALVIGREEPAVKMCIRDRAGNDGYIDEVTCR